MLDMDANLEAIHAKVNYARAVTTSLRKVGLYLCEVLHGLWPTMFVAEYRTPSIPQCLLHPCSFNPDANAAKDLAECIIESGAQSIDLYVLTTQIW